MSSSKEQLEGVAEINLSYLAGEWICWSCNNKFNFHYDRTKNATFMMCITDGISYAMPAGIKGKCPQAGKKFQIPKVQARLVPYEE